MEDFELEPHGPCETDLPQKSTKGAWILSFCLLPLAFDLQPSPSRSTPETSNFAGKSPRPRSDDAAAGQETRGPMAVSTDTRPA